MAQENIFTTIAQGIGNTNQNVVDLYNLVQEAMAKINEIHDALYPEDIAEPTSDGTTTTDKK
jgi:hypothetical protein